MYNVDGSFLIKDGPDKFNVANASISVAHTYGNVTSVIARYIENLLPKNFFRTVQVSSKVAYREFDYRRNSQRDFFKKRRPILAIKPRIVLNDDDRFLAGTYLTTTIFENENAMNWGELQPFFEDTDKQIYVKYRMNRMVMEFDIAIVQETLMEQLNIVTYLQNRVRQNLPFFIETALESHIDDSLIKILSEQSGVPIRDDEGSVKNFLDYVNSHSYYPVTYKLKNSTGRDAFFRYYNTNLDVTISEFEMDELTKTNQLNTHSMITFRCKCEFTGAGTYYLFTRDDIKIDSVDIDLGTDNPEDTIIPLLTVNNKRPGADLVPDDWDLYTTSLFKVEQKDFDNIDMKDLFTKTTRYNICYNIQQGVPGYTFIKFLIMKDNEYLREFIDFIVDYKNMVVTIADCNLDSTYRVYVYMDLNAMNNIVTNIMDFETKELPSFREPEFNGDDDLELKEFLDKAEESNYLLEYNIDDILKNMLDKYYKSSVLNQMRFEKFFRMTVADNKELLPFQTTSKYGVKLSEKSPLLYGNFNTNKLSTNMIRTLDNINIEKGNYDLTYTSMGKVSVVCIPIWYECSEIIRDGVDISKYFDIKPATVNTAMWGRVKYNVYISKKTFDMYKDISFKLIDTREEI